jgi:hypothetical protein
MYKEDTLGWNFEGRDVGKYGGTTLRSMYFSQQEGGSAPSRLCGPAKESRFELSAATSSGDSALLNFLSHPSWTPSLHLFLHLSFLDCRVTLADICS